MRLIYIMVCMMFTGCAVITEYPTTAASMAIWGTTGKSTTDHIISYATDKDCKTLRVFSQYKNEYICEDKPIQQKVYKLRKLENVQEWAPRNTKL